MRYSSSPPRHEWRATSLVFLAACMFGALACALIAVGSVELLRVTCDRGEDHCVVVNATLLGGQTERAFAPSDVVEYRSGTTQERYSVRGQSRIATHEQPAVVLTDGAEIELRVTESQVMISTSTFAHFYRFLGDPKRDRFDARDFFSGLGLPLGALALVVLSWAGFLGARVARLELDVEAQTVRFLRLGAFSPARHQGRLDGLEACVLQPDPNRSSPGVFLLTRQGEWLAVSFHTSFVSSEAFGALEEALDSVGVPVVQADEARHEPRIDYTWALVGLGVLTCGLVLLAIVAVGVAFLVVS